MTKFSDRMLTITTSVLLGLILGIATGVFAKKENADTLPLLELQTFAEVFDQIKKSYVKEVDDQTLLEHAVEGMLSGLDPHSSYLDPEMFKDLQINTSGEFGGLGIEVTMENGFVKVIAPIDDTPAQKAGVQAGDVIIKLDDTPVKGLTLRDAVNIMRGKVGTDILLTIVRTGVEKPVKTTITRDVIKVRSVKSQLLEDGFGMVRVSQFQLRTDDDLEEHIEKLKDKSSVPLKGLILDLRNNPGGVLRSAVDVSDLFLTEGLIVYTDGRIEDTQMRFNAKSDDILDGAPIIVLINSGSASASEIVAGALQDHDRAIIMGTKSFGKGSVQTVLPLKNDRALKLTTALYYTPNGRSIQAEGIEPDLEVKQINIGDATQLSSESYSEADLQGHLSNANGDNTDGDTKAKNGTDVDNDEKALLKTDYQLHEALNVLKGISLLRAKK